MEPTLLGRRAFLMLLGGALASRPARSFAQQDTVRTVAVLMGFSEDAEAKERAEAFEQGLKRKGWTIGEDLRIEYRYSGGNIDRMRAFAEEFAALEPDCIVGQSTPVVKALMQATRTIPIVFVAVTDPIGSGFVSSMASPGGNATGFTIIQGTITGKYLSILRELIPGLTRAAIVYNPASAPGAGMVFLPAFVQAAKRYKIEPITIPVHTAAEIENGFARLADQPDTGMIVMPDNFTSLHRKLLTSLATRYRVPTIYPYRYFVEEGGLLSYGVDAIDLFRQAADYVSRILRGANPANLPVQAPTKFELVINLKAAKELDITVPRVLLAGAHEVYR